MAGSLHVTIRRVARRLARPAKAGVYISIPDLVKIAGAIDVPLPVRQDREWVAEELLKAALDYGRLDAACQALINLIRERIAEVEALAKTYTGAAELLESYLEAANETVEELEKLREKFKQSKAVG